MVEGILNAGPEAWGIAVCLTDYRSWAETAAVYEKVMGRPTAFIEADDVTYMKLFGGLGRCSGCSCGGAKSIRIGMSWRER